MAATNTSGADIPTGFSCAIFKVFVHMALQLCEMVRIQSLTSPLGLQLNGQVGCCVDFLQEVDRWEVSLPDGSSNAIREAHLVPVRSRSRTPPRHACSHPLSETPPRPLAPNNIRRDQVLREYAQAHTAILEQLAGKLGPLGIHVYDRLRDPSFALALRVHLLGQAMPRLLIVGLNPTPQAQQPFDARTPSGKLVHNLMELASGRGVRIMTWNIAPGATFNRNGADLSVADVLELAALTESGGDGVDSATNLVRHGCKLLGHILEAKPSLTHILALSRFVTDILNGAIFKWPCMVLLSQRHPGHALRLQESDRWVSEALTIIDALAPAAPASGAGSLREIQSPDVPVSVLAQGGGPSSFNHTLSVKGIVIRRHSFKHGGGSLRLWDGAGFVDVKFIAGGALKYAAVDKRWKWLRIYGIKVFRIRPEFQRLAALGTTHELVVSDAGAELTCANIEW